MKTKDQQALELIYEEIYNEGFRSTFAQLGSNIGKMFSGDQAAAYQKTYQIFAQNVLKSINKLEQTISNEVGELPYQENSPVLIDVQKVTEWLKPFLQNPAAKTADKGGWTYAKALTPSSRLAQTSTSDDSIIQPSTKPESDKVQKASKKVKELENKLNSLKKEATRSGMSQQETNKLLTKTKADYDKAKAILDKLTGTDYKKAIRTKPEKSLPSKPTDGTTLA